MMNRATYTIKAYTLLALRVVKGDSMPYHSKELETCAERAAPANKKYLHNGIWNTAKAIASGECKLHWLRD